MTLAESFAQRVHFSSVYHQIWRSLTLCAIHLVLMRCVGDITCVVSKFEFIIPCTAMDMVQSSLNKKVCLEHS